MGPTDSEVSQDIEGPHAEMDIRIKFYKICDSKFFNGMNLHLNLN